MCQETFTAPGLQEPNEKQAFPWRAVAVRFWQDEKVCALSPQAKLLFLAVLTHENMTTLGVMRGSPDALFPLVGLSHVQGKKAFAELAGMVCYDKKFSILHCPNYLKYNRPHNYGIIMGWSKIIESLPHCETLLRVLSQAEMYTAALKSKTIRDTFASLFGNKLAAWRREFHAAAAGPSGGSIPPIHQEGPSGGSIQTTSLPVNIKLKINTEDEADEDVPVICDLFCDQEPADQEPADQVMPDQEPAGQEPVDQFYTPPGQDWTEAQGNAAFEMWKNTQIAQKGASREAQLKQASLPVRPSRPIGKEGMEDGKRDRTGVQGQSGQQGQTGDAARDPAGDCARKEIYCRLNANDGFYEMSLAEFERWQRNYPDLDAAKIVNDMRIKLEMAQDFAPPIFRMSRWINTFFKNERDSRAAMNRRLANRPDGGRDLVKGALEFARGLTAGAGA